MKLVLEISFLALSNTDIQYDTESFTWKSYSTIKALPTARWIELIDKHELAKTVLDKNSETFIAHVSALEALESAVYPSQAVLLAAPQQD